MSTTAFALEPADERSGARYAGFGLRLAAGLVDLLVYESLIALGFWAVRRERCGHWALHALVMLLVLVAVALPLLR
jgi:hypothetical protein